MYFGFFAADGCITEYEMKIGISSKDINILQKIKSVMKSDVDIKLSDNYCSFNNKVTTVALLSIASKYLVNSLKNIGFDKNKTISCVFPNISEDFYLPFIRGYFDGDGSLTNYIANDGYERYTCTMCGTKSFLLFIKKYLEDKHQIKFNSKLYKRFDTENCCYSLNLSGRNNCIHFLNTIYKDSNIYLDRKYNKYLSFI